MWDGGGGVQRRFVCLEFQSVRFVIGTFTSDKFPLFYGVMGCGGAAEATGLGFVCFVVINTCVLSANRVDFGFFFFVSYIVQFTPPPPQRELHSTVHGWDHYCPANWGGCRGKDGGNNEWLSYDNGPTHLNNSSSFWLQSLSNHIPIGYLIFKSAHFFRSNLIKPKKQKQQKHRSRRSQKFSVMLWWGGAELISFWRVSGCAKLWSQFSR